MTIFDLRPYEGAGPLSLGMSPDEVHVVLGTPVRSAIKGGERDETYQGLTVGYAAGTDRIIEIAFTSKFDVRFNGINLFTSPDAVELLAAADGAPLEGLGSVVFLALGIAVVDFDSDQENDRVVQVFERGRWDVVTHLKPYSRPTKS